MKKVIKQVVGIDVAQKELVVTFGKLEEDLAINLVAYHVFKNTEKGFDQLILWAKKLLDDAAELRFVMESTGIYHEKFAYYMEEKGYNISVVLPNKISSYIRTLD